MQFRSRKKYTICLAIYKYGLTDQQVRFVEKRRYFKTCERL